MNDVTPGPLSEAPAVEHGSRLGPLFSWARDLLLSLIIAAVIILFIYQPVQVEGTSMEPTLVPNERIFINKFTYRFGLERIERGDMVVFWYPAGSSKSYIKRVIGLPGEEVSIDKGTVYVNGKPLREDYVLPAHRDASNMLPQRVPENSYFVLGDHRQSSKDSRSIGSISRSSIYGKAVFVYWPPDRIGPVR